MKIKLSCQINGKKYSTENHSMARLLDVIREDFQLTGTKEGCGEGECGACSIMLNGKLVNSCLVPIMQAQDAVIETIEGMAAPDGKLNYLQQAFLQKGGAQCGICTPGMLMACKNLLQQHRTPTLEQIQEGLSGNLCRCTGHTKIIESVQACFDQGDQL
jgi:carbon-monoxide dehydrogenase small subunit